MDVLHAAWQASGQVTPAGLMFDRQGYCARCHGQGAVTADTVVSAKWTGWSSWRTAISPRLCAGCAWGYRTTALRTGAHLVTSTPTMQFLTPAALAHTLATAIPSNAAVVLPMHRNRKHVLPEARWGRLCVDDVALPWTAGDALRLEAMMTLRGLGFSTSSMERPAPPFKVLSRLGSEQYRAVLALWKLLGPWRPATPWFAAAALVTGLNAAAAA